MNRRQFGSGLLGTVGAIGVNRLAKATQPPSLTAESRTHVRFTFAGLIVFRQDRDIFELGVLRARDLNAGMAHIFQINIVDLTNNQTSPAKPQEVLESYIQNGDVAWTIEVRDAQGTQLRGVKANIGIPSDRHHPSASNEKDFGWMINLESVEFHQQTLERSAGKLKPVISMQYGTLETVCKTDAIDTKKGLSTYHDFGYITGGGALTIDTSNNEVVVLKTQQQADILNLAAGRSYDIEVLNAPLKTSTVPTGGHFGLYYQLLFDKVRKGSRFKIKKHPGANPASDSCPEMFKVADNRDPEPYKCGGILINESSGPLG
jgi:hypothetical protein